MKTLPKNLYVRIDEPDRGEPYLISSARMDELGIEVGDKTKIGVYKLVGTYNAEGTITTSKFCSDLKP
jgi:hypothetical protein